MQEGVARAFHSRLAQSDSRMLIDSPEAHR